MADAKTFTIDGTDISIIDETARNRASAALESAEYDRLSLVGKYPGQDLATVLAAEIGSGENVYDALQARVQDADFSGLRVGDYIDVQLTEGANVPAQTVRYVIGAIDPYYQCDDRSKGHHIAMVPREPVTVRGEKASNTSYLQWRATADNNGTAETKCPYLVSKLHDWEINDFLPSLPSTLQSVLMTQRVLLEERYSASGKLTEPSSWSWQDLGKVWSPSEIEVYGFHAWSKPGYGSGFDCQFPLFKQTKDRVSGSRVFWWLRSVSGSSASDVCYVYGNGGAASGSPADNWVRPRPCLLVG